MMANEMSEQVEEHGSSPASRGGAGTYIEGELGAFYMLAMLAGIPAHGLPNSQIVRVRFQGTDLGYKLDDLIIHGVGPSGDTLLEIQSKRDLTFSPKDAVYREVAEQIARSQLNDVPEELHFLGIATQRTSRKISGAYQDVLKWASAAETSVQFYKRLNTKGVSNAAMREFESTSRQNLVAGGVVDDDEAIWRVLRRLLILEFDFESSAPLARTHAQMLARQVLADEDVGSSEALLRTLIEISIETGTVGGSLALQELRSKLLAAGFRLVGHREYGPARTKLTDMAEMTLACIGSMVAGVSLPRLEAVAALDEAMDTHRFVEVRGGPGVGKSWVLRNAAERVARQSPVIVLDPVSTPPGGWIAFAQALGIPGTAKGFLSDLAASGGGAIFVDGLDMFTDPGRQRTVSDLLRAASAVPDFSVIATSRKSSDGDAETWLDDNITAGFGGVRQVSVGELSDAEVAVLVEQAPELRLLLEAGHPASKLARNLYRLSQLVKVPNNIEIRTEAALAHLWWKTADSAAPTDVRPAQRILADLALHSLKGGNGIELQSDSNARSHLLGSLTLKEVRRDRLDLYHDVLRDWAIGTYLFEDPSRLDVIDTSGPVSQRVSRGIEFASRLTLELNPDHRVWADLLARLSPEGAHSSWRRQAMLAMTRSEAGFELLEKYSAELLADGGMLLQEIVTTIATVETVATADIMQLPESAKTELMRSHRTDTTGAAMWLLRWVLKHQHEVPLQAIGAVIELVEIQFVLLKWVPSFAQPAATMLFRWLRELDVREAEVTIPADKSAGYWNNDYRRRMVEKLRTTALLLGEFAPDHLKAYLTEVATERDRYKAKDVRLFSQVIAPVAPAELSALIAAVLIDQRDREGRRSSSIDRAFTFADSDFMPPSPAQPPFFDLLQTAPIEGLKLIRTLVAEAVKHHHEGRDPDGDGFTIVFDEVTRFFPCTSTYFWSRDQAREYSVASGLKALEAWGQKRLDDGELVEIVLADILGPEGSCAAYLLVAVDVLLSHFGQCRAQLVPFMGCPELLAVDRMRVSRDQIGLGQGLFDGKEPSGKVTLADLKARTSRQVSLTDALPNYLGDDPAAQALRVRLGSAVEKLEPYESHSNWVDKRFIGRFAQNMLNRDNWIDVGDGKLAYQPPPDEAAHLEQMQQRHAGSAQASETDAQISLAVEGGDHATTATARIAVDFADGDLPDDSDTDSLKSRSTRLIATAMLVARDGDDALLDEHEPWVRQVIDLGLAEKSDRVGGSSEHLRFNRPALATLALIHLWLRKRSKADRDRLISLAARRDCSASVAFAAALPQLIELEPRMLKAATRAAFATCRWRWHSYGEDEAEQQRFNAHQNSAAQSAVAAEIDWLDGGNEPAWPKWPEERPILRRALRMSVPMPTSAEESIADEGEDGDDIEGTSAIHVDSAAAAQWLAMVNDSRKGTISWGHEIVEGYSGWTASVNGIGLPINAEIDREPSEWNLQYFALFAQQLMEAPSDRFEADIQLITQLPDEPFNDVAEIVIQAADALYFNNPQCPPTRPVELRSRLAHRVVTLRQWKYVRDPASLSIGREVAGVVAKMLLNTHNPFNGTNSYLPAALSERLDPLLEPMRPLLPGGPTSFVALCVMNLLLVTPRARHLNFLLDAADEWFERAPDATFWTATSTGRRMVEWFEAAVAEQPELMAPDYPLRNRIDRVLGRLVGVGIAEAHELEKKIISAADSA